MYQTFGCCVERRQWCLPSKLLSMTIFSMEVRGLTFASLNCTLVKRVHATMACLSLCPFVSLSVFVSFFSISCHQMGGISSSCPAVMLHMYRSFSYADLLSPSIESMASSSSSFFSSTWHGMCCPVLARAISLSTVYSPVPKPLILVGVGLRRLGKIWFMCHFFHLMLISVGCYMNVIGSWCRDVSFCLFFTKDASKRGLWVIVSVVNLFSWRQKVFWFFRTSKTSMLWSNEDFSKNAGVGTNDGIIAVSVQSAVLNHASLVLFVYNGGCN